MKFWCKQWQKMGFLNSVTVSFDHNFTKFYCSVSILTPKRFMTQILAYFCVLSVPQTPIMGWNERKWDVLTANNLNLDRRGDDTVVLWKKWIFFVPKNGELSREKTKKTEIGPNSAWGLGWCKPPDGVKGCPWKLSIFLAFEGISVVVTFYKFISFSEKIFQENGKSKEKMEIFVHQKTDNQR